MNQKKFQLTLQGIISRMSYLAAIIFLGIAIYKLTLFSGNSTVYQNELQAYVSKFASFATGFFVNGAMAIINLLLSILFAIVGGALHIADTIKCKDEGNKQVASNN